MSKPITIKLNQQNKSKNKEAIVTLLCDPKHEISDYNQIHAFDKTCRKRNSKNN